MMRSLQHRFVQYLPETLEPGILYISLDYATASHLCCCGCGEEVVTPFSPVGWRMTFDGEAISLWPSIGNWNLRCRSHYIIREGRVIGAGQWSNEQIEQEQQRDKAAKATYYGVTSVIEGEKDTSGRPENSSTKPWWSRISDLLFGQRK